MKNTIFVLAILLLSCAVLSKPTTSRREENLLDTLLALQQGYGDDMAAIEQEDDGDGNALIQHESDEEPSRKSSIAVQIQELSKLHGQARFIVLAKLQALEKRASDKTEAQWWHHLFHLAWHIIRHHHRHCHG